MKLDLLLHCCLASLMSSTVTAFVDFGESDGQPTQIRICERPYVNDTASAIIYGSIESPGYPSAYVGPYDCTVTVKTPAMTWVGFYAHEDFQIHEAENGCADFVSIQNTNTQTPSVTRCGNIQPDTPLYSESSLEDGGSIDVRFHADGDQRNTQGRFSVSFKVADLIYPGSNRDHSKQAILNNVGYVVSHPGFTGNADDNDYDNNIHSTFTLTGFPPNTLVELFFYSMNLHFDDNCSDSLNISGITLADYRQDFPGPLFLCGSDNHEVANYVKTMDNFIRFTFKTGPSGAKSGFLIQYRVIPELPDYSENTGDYSSVDFVTTTAFSPKKGVGSDAESDYKDWTPTYIGIGVGSGILVIIVIAVVLALCLRKRSSRCCGGTTQTICPVSVDGTNRSGSGHTNSDDESAYYSEVGTFQKQNLKNEVAQTGKSNNNSHYYSSRPVTDVHFYHMIERENQNHPKRSATPLPPVPSTATPPRTVYHTLEDELRFTPSPDNQNSSATQGTPNLYQPASRSGPPPPPPSAVGDQPPPVDFSKHPALKLDRMGSYV